MPGGRRQGKGTSEKSTRRREQTTESKEAAEYAKSIEDGWQLQGEWYSKAGETIKIVKVK